MPPTKKRTDERLAKRMFAARQQLERQKSRRVPLEEIGAAVAAAMGRAGDPYAPTVVGRWLRGESEPESRKLWFALASTLGVDVGWLAFGAATAAPSPDGFVEEAEAVHARRRASGGSR